MSDKLNLIFRGIDSWGRPVFKSDNGSHYGSTLSLFNDNDTKETVLSHFSKYDQRRLHHEIVYFGDGFGCEPDGTHIYTSIYITLG